ncbi:MAG TPA: hypothetical protein VKH18_03565 [Terriglobales bacterium]|nr:hypothetical protein [Terriglobales bacterium]
MKTARRGVAALGAVLFDGHTLALAQQVDAIVADGRVGVCAGDHWAFVMNRGWASPAVRGGRGTRPNGGREED